VRESERPPVAIAPDDDEGLVEAVARGGGRLAPPTTARALVWTDPHDPQGMRRTVDGSPATWIQLPLAGIEAFHATGVIDPGRTWTCAKGIYGPACAEHAVMIMLAIARRLPHHLRATSWVPVHFGSGERRLRDATVLVVGTGGIGRALAAMLAPLGTRLLAVNRSGAPLDGAERTETTEELPALLPEADFVVLAASLTAATRHLFDRDMLARMRPDAWVVNVARGGLVDTDALVAALREGSIGGAALDVTEPEPLPDGHPLWELDNAIITPHTANTMDMGIVEYRSLVARNVAHFARGEPLEGLVDPALGY
jgi:phosphoglycerate dehydrogenase-like enzyme